MECAMVPFIEYMLAVSNRRLLRSLTMDMPSMLNVYNVKLVMIGHICIEGYLKLKEN